MNCDQAFDVMTSSRGAHDSELHDHMQRCPRCREMHETLEPALGMLRADVLLSSTWEPQTGESEGLEIATRAARRLSTVEVIPDRGATSLRGYFGAIVLGAGLVWATFMMNPAAMSFPEVHRGQSTCLFRERPRTAGITGQQMTQSCLACHSVSGSR
jgi:hypothetical protein